MITRSPACKRYAAAPLAQISPGGRLDRVRHQAFAVGEVVDVNLLVFENPRLREQLGINRAPS